MSQRRAEPAWVVFVGAALAVSAFGVRRPWKGQDGRLRQEVHAGTSLIMAIPERTLGAPGGTVIPPALAWRRAGETEPNPGGGSLFVPVAVAAAVVVPVVVVPPTAPEHAAGG